MKAFTNVKPKKKSEPSTTKEKVINTFEKAQKKGDQSLAADTKKAKAVMANRKDLATKRWKESTDLEVKGRYQGAVSTKDLQGSRAYTAHAKNSHNELAEVKGKQQTGAYDAKPAVVGGTKRMLVKSKKNVNKSAASKSAKRSARKLY